MAKKFAELRNKMSPESRARSEAKTKALLLEMSLQELRQQMSELSQEDVAELLEVTQGYVSRLERQKDLSVRRLKEFVSVLGGQIEILANFPDKQVRVTQFDDLEELGKELRQAKGA